METSEISFRHLPLEIVHLVLEHLRRDETSLRAAILVDRTWAAEGISILGKPPTPALVLLTSSRRQYYASQVRILTAHEAHHEIFRSLEFPRLRSVMIVFGCREDKEQMCFSPTSNRTWRNFSLAALCCLNTRLVCWNLAAHA